MKVYDLAKELKTDLKEFVGFLREVDIKVKSGSTKLDEKTVHEIRTLYKGEPGTEDTEGARDIELEGDTIQVSDLADLLKVKLSEIMKACLERKLLVNLNTELDFEVAKM